MRILRILSSVDPASGGPIEAVRQVSKIHKQQGHEVELLSMDDPIARWVAACEFPVHALGPGAGVYSYTSRLKSWLMAHQNSYDAIFVEGLWQYHSFGTWRGLRGSGRAYCVFPHGMLDPYFKKRYPLKHLKKAIYWRLAEHRVLRDARYVFFTCDEERQRAAQSFRPYRCHERVVTLGTMSPPGNRLTQRAAFLNQFPELRGKRIVLFLGRLHEKKGCDLLIEAFAKCAHAGGDFHLVMAGPDGMGWRAHLESLAKRSAIIDRVTWPGMLEGDMKWGAFHTAEVFMLPSHQENFGVAVAEALACSMPVLISDKVNIWREIVNQNAGFAENDDAAGTQRLLERWIALPAEQRIAMQHNAKCCFDEHFEVHRAAAMQLEIAAN